MSFFACGEAPVLDEEITLASWITSAGLYLQYLGVVLLNSVVSENLEDYLGWAKFFAQPLVLENVEGENQFLNLYAVGILGLLPLTLLLCVGWKSYIINDWSGSYESRGLTFYIFLILGSFLLLFGLFFKSAGLSQAVAFVTISVALLLYLSTFGFDYCRTISSANSQFLQVFLTAKSLFYVPLCLNLSEALVVSNSAINDEALIGSLSVYISAAMLALWISVDTVIFIVFDSDEELFYFAPIYYALLLERIAFALFGGMLGDEDFQDTFLNETSIEGRENFSLFWMLTILFFSGALIVFLRPFHSPQENQLQIYPRLAIFVQVALLCFLSIVPEIVVESIFFFIAVATFLFLAYRMLMSHQLLYDYLGEYLEHTFVCWNDWDFTGCWLSVSDLLLCPRGTEDFDRSLNNEESLWATLTSALILYLQYFGVILVDKVDLGLFQTGFGWVAFFSQPLQISEITTESDFMVFFAVGMVALLPALLLLAVFGRTINEAWFNPGDSEGILRFYCTFAISSVIFLVGAFLAGFGLEDDLTFIVLSVAFALYLVMFTCSVCRIVFTIEEYQRLYTEVKSWFYVPLSLTLADSIILSASDDEAEANLGSTGTFVTAMTLLLLLFVDTGVVVSYSLRDKDSEDAEDMYFYSPRYYLLTYERIFMALAGGLLGSQRFDDIFLSDKTLDYSDNLALLGFGYILGFTTSLFVCFRPFESATENQLQIYPRLSLIALITAISLRSVVPEVVLQALLFSIVTFPLLIWVLRSTGRCLLEES